MKTKTVMFNADVRAAEPQENGDEKRIIRGYAALFNVETDKVSYYYSEKIDRHAFDNTDLTHVCLLVGHDFCNLLAMSLINMRVEIDETGLFFEADLPDTQLGRDTYTLVKMGILTGVSIGFYADVVESDYDNKLETIMNVAELYELSLTPIPAYEETIALAREQEKISRENDEKIKTLKDQIGGM